MKPRMILSAAALAAMMGPVGAEAPEGACEPAYRLYRNSAAGNAPAGRMRIATFDSCEQVPPGGLSYNEGNCEIARSLFQEQPGVRVTYWCEPVDLN